MSDEEIIIPTLAQLECKECKGKTHEVYLVEVGLMVKCAGCGLLVDTIHPQKLAHIIHEITAHHEAHKDEELPN